MYQTKRVISEGAEEVLGLYFPVLDHGFIGLIDYCGNDKSIADAARCSYGAGTKTISDDKNLIRYLLRQSHTSPFEQVEIKFHCKAPIFVARQWIRHRTANLNEYSGRYSIIPMQFYKPNIENVKYQSKNNKQGRDNAVEIEKAERYIENSNHINEQISEHYKYCLEEDFARELARITLPLSTYTEWYWKIDLHNLLHFLKLRCDSHSQWEIQQYGNIMAGIIEKSYPIAFQAWLDYSFCSRKFSYQDLLALNELLSKIKDKNISDDKLLEIGLNKREVSEFFTKLNIPDVPNFSIKIEDGKTPEYFQEQAKKFVPKT